MKTRIIIVLLGALLIASSVNARDQLNLSGPGWKLWQDKEAAWQNEPLFAPPVNLAEVPAFIPTGGWHMLTNTDVLDVSVPGTVVEYAFRNPDLIEIRASKLYEQFLGVSWWSRSVEVPKSFAGKRLILKFEAVRQRAEVFVNQQLVAYDVVGYTPFEVDITDLIKPGSSFELDVRVTNPGGNYDWEDFRQFKWGDYVLPYGHAFGGITGDVRLEAVGPVYLQDVYVQNTPEPKRVVVHATVRNTKDKSNSTDLQVSVYKKDNPDKVLFSETLKSVQVGPGDHIVKINVDVPTAKLWDLKNPNLYVADVQLVKNRKQTDGLSTAFGFRWFEVDGIGKNALFRLNGKRIVIRTSISWGYWPVNVYTPTEALAEQHIHTAQELGLNMLNFHRGIGQPLVLDKADEMGLLYYAEPGGYIAGGTDPFAQQLAREKLFRMIKRDRSHPSLVIYNMVNEQWDFFGADKDPVMREVFKKDIAKAHAIDPSRVITFASTWSEPGEHEQFTKLHMRPFDDRLHFQGWWDLHRANGPETWRDGFYRGPEDHFMHTDNASEIVFWGEEGAVSAPPRMALLKKDFEAEPRLGFDGAIYLHWYDLMDGFLTRKNLRSAFPDVDAFTKTLSEVSFAHQGRKIEDFRICDLNDGYTVNGWEAQPFENHSSVVDIFRHPKSDPSIISYYNQPLYIAVKGRGQVNRLPAKPVVDFYVVNEVDLKGPHSLEMKAIAPDGKIVFSKTQTVDVAGGDTYGQLLLRDVEMTLEGLPGVYRLEAHLLDKQGNVKAKGHDTVVTVDWESASLSGNGAIFESNADVSRFLKEGFGLDIPAYDGTQDKLDWLVISRPPKPFMELVGRDDLIDKAGKPGGLTVSYYRGNDFREKFGERVDERVYFDADRGATPDPSVPLIQDYSIRWEGQIIPPTTGEYEFMMLRDGRDEKMRLHVNGQKIIDNWNTPLKRGPNPGNIQLEGGKPVSIVVESYNGDGGARTHLLWKAPGQESIDPVDVLKRAERDGTTIIIADYAEDWMQAMQEVTGVEYNGRIDVGINWRGGQFFAREHDLFDGLPVNTALNWPYQRLVKNGRSRYALDMEGEELVAGAWQSMGCRLGTSVGVVSTGEGKIILSTLEICPAINEPAGPADIARKLLVNYLESANAK
ncbi:PA14 domain-containing protein [Maribacter polysaccharolyticus]|uniref:PA14 domain-containing protein n=1 Tax=Maribacter polysaccharolyticus TaxID=3020831 RepID=UPI00237F8B64|nr:PA14 domain-containing protein [Maribacter polysaccharolyticus]MDE3741295.1 PA14 domain-containing protein [Maribacter polysaccharolyticus]